MGGMWPSEESPRRSDRGPLTPFSVTSQARAWGPYHLIQLPYLFYKYVPSVCYARAMCQGWGQVSRHSQYNVGETREGLSQVDRYGTLCKHGGGPRIQGGVGLKEAFSEGLRESEFTGREKRGRALRAEGTARELGTRREQHPDVRSHCSKAGGGESRLEEVLGNCQ